MKLAIVKGTTSYTVYVFIQNSSSTTGAGLTGLVYNSASLVAYYVRNRGSATAITLATQTVTGAFSSGGFVEVDATNMPGVYRLDLPDAALASGSDFAVVMLKGATNMAPVALEIQLTGCDLNDAADLGLTALTGHVPQTGDAFARIGVNGAGLTAIDLPDQTMNITGNITGNLSGSVGSVTGAVGSVTGNVGGNVAGSVGSVTAAVTVGTNNDKAGYALSAAGVQAVWDALTSALTTASSIGKLLVDNVNATISSRSSHSAADVWASGTRTLTSFGTLVADIWDRATSALTTVGSVGKLIVDNLNATVSSRSSHSAADVWAAGTRTLTAGTNIVLAKGTGVTGFTDLDAAGVRSAVGLAAANLDTQLDAIPTATENADALLDRNMGTGTDSGSSTVRTVRQALRALRNRVAISGGTLTTYKEDDATASWTATVTTSAGNPVSSIDPTGP